MLEVKIVFFDVKKVGMILDRGLDWKRNKVNDIELILIKGEKSCFEIVNL